MGLCGSGILDLLAQLRRNGLIDARGAFSKDGGNFLQQGQHGIEFVIRPGAEDAGKTVTFDRKDITETQLAKGAIRAGGNLLLKRAGVTEADIDELIIAGAFGTYLDVQSCLDIGMFPRVDRNKIKQVGNAAGAGARMALLSLEQRQHARQIARQIEYVELTTEPDFQSEFAHALSIG